ncbi:hypothetical protein EMCRGX_G033215 [Ephydatia muelleri]
MVLVSLFIFGRNTTNHKSRVPLEVLQDAFQQHAAEVELVLKEKTWSEVEDTLKKMLLESVIALMAFHKYPVPNESTLVKRVKDFYTTRRSTSLIKADPERRKQRRVTLKRSRLIHAARDKVVRDAIESGELTADDKESIEKLRSSVAMVPLSDVDVASDEEERATFEKQRLLHLSRARAVRAAHRSEELV